MVAQWQAFAEPHPALSDRLAAIASAAGAMVVSLVTFADNLHARIAPKAFRKRA